MQFASYTPNDRLAPFVRAYRVLESDRGVRNRILPDTAIAAAFRFKGTVTYTEAGAMHHLPTAVITGIRGTSRVLDYAPNTATFVVQFREAGAGAFFRESLADSFGISVPLADLAHGAGVHETEEQLSEAKDDLSRVAIVERFLLSRFVPQTDTLVSRAIQKIKQANGDVRIRDLAADLYLSQDALEKRFRRVTGTRPKQFSTIVRLRHLIDRYPQAKNGTDAALEAGYYDQAHFIKEFKTFTGQTPHEFFQAPRLW